MEMTMEFLRKLPTPLEIKEQYPIGDDLKKIKETRDQEIMDILNSKGIEISRRTVAKYRESMNIPSSSRRRRY